MDSQRLPGSFEYDNTTSSQILEEEAVVRQVNIRKIKPGWAALGLLLSSCFCFRFFGDNRLGDPGGALHINIGVGGWGSTKDINIKSCDGYIRDHGMYVSPHRRLLSAACQMQCIFTCFPAVRSMQYLGRWGWGFRYQGTRNLPRPACGLLRSPAGDLEDIFSDETSAVATENWPCEDRVYHEHGLLS